MKSRAVLVVVGVCLASILASTSLAAGGPTIAAAPIVVSGQQNFGNTVGMADQSGYRREYWRLQLTTGDATTINFSNASPDSLRVYIFAPDVTDFNVLRSNPEADERPQENGKGQLQYVARRSGAYPLMFRTGCGAFCGGKGGPFDFVAYIKHAVRLFVPARSSVSRRGVVSVQVRNPDGAPITDKGLRVTLRGIWGKRARTLGKTTPANGAAKFKLNLPVGMNGQTIRIRAIAQGRDYIGTSSVTRALRVK